MRDCESTRIKKDLINKVTIIDHSMKSILPYTIINNTHK